MPCQGDGRDQFWSHIFKADYGEEALEIQDLKLQKTIFNYYSEFFILTGWLYL